VFDRLKHAITRPKVPEYTAVRETPTRGLPSELAEQEAGQSHSDPRSASNVLRISVARSGESSCATGNEPPHNSVLN